MGEKNYFLMRKNDIVTIVRINSEGKMLAFASDIGDSARQIAPIAYMAQPGEWLYKWWDDRSVPITRYQIKDFLRKAGYTGPEQYLVKNLGLSLTDYYWIKDPDSPLKWKDVNLYENEFHENILLAGKHPKDDGIPRYSPNASLQGNIEKTWTIVDGRRCLVKGNHSGLSAESINETIACKLHEMQGYDNYVNYSLLHIKNKPYDYGCISTAFTSLDKELVSAWAVCTSEQRSPNKSLFEHFIDVCGKHGIDKEQLRCDLEYQIMTDYLLTGYDRHMNNISVLRDANTLRFIRMAPIYDSGDSLFANRPVPRNTKELNKMEIASFCKSESKLLKLVRDKKIIDLTKVPSPEYIKKCYEKDSKVSEKHISDIIYWYEKKIDMVRNLQLEKPLDVPVIPFG